MINRRAIFTDETSTFKTPYEPMPGDTVTLRLRTLRNDILRAYAVVNGIRRSMTKQPSHFEDEFDFYSVSFVCSEKCVKYYFELFDEDDKVAYNRLGCVENAQPEYNFSFLPASKSPTGRKVRFSIRFLPTVSATASLTTTSRIKNITIRAVIQKKLPSGISSPTSWTCAVSTAVIYRA